ncbi:hypothetical protein [Brevibacillus laterosporus]|uniref:hypothetical protein n=1 Tax=Brevibacillus laterosporus TaxID=1465 RepID=UPI00215C33E6|nr:hypothetical protein [Brevibacillus laterosporus]MCR8994696.1 hypothetical protein [Brevibacillus laterosporus]
MKNYFKEANRYAYSNYRGYCNKVRHAGIEPVDFHAFCKELSHLHKSKWVEMTKKLNRIGHKTKAK